MRPLRAALVAVLLLLALAPAAAAAPAAGTAYLRLAHLSPDTPPVDVYVSAVADPDRSFVLPGVGYGAVSPYRPVPPGSYVVSMRMAGANPASAPVISATVDAQPGAAYTVAGLGMSAELGLTVLRDRLDMPAPGRATVRVINAAPSTPVVDVGPPGEEPWARDVRFGTATAYTDVPLGRWELQVTADGRTVTVLPVELDVNSVYTVLLVDRNGTIDAELHRDSTGTGTVPIGGVETGLGGTAGGTGLAGGLALALLGGLLAALAVRTPRVRGR